MRSRRGFKGNRRRFSLRRGFHGRRHRVKSFGRRARRQYVKVSRGGIRL